MTASGLVTGLQPGVARFTAAFGGLTGAISIIITPGPNQGTGAVTGQILNGAIGAPISGDRLYGGKDITGTSGFFLHGASIAFPFAGETIAVEAPLPARFTAALAAVGL